MLFKFPISRVDDINVLRPGFDVAGTYNAKKAMAAFRHITDPARSAYLADGADYDMRVRNFERDMAGLIAAHPDVTFEIYFPPYSILQWVAMRDASPQTFEQVYNFTAYVSRRLTSFPNVRLYDFREAKDVTHDLNNYADVIHHSPTIDLKVLSWLAEGKYRRRSAPRRRRRSTGSRRRWKRIGCGRDRVAHRTSAPSRQRICLVRASRRMRSAQSRLSG